MNYKITVFHTLRNGLYNNGVSHVKKWSIK
jgi:hypothetical protein